MAQGFEEVTWIDFSARFISIAEEIRSRGVIRYTLPVEGELTEYREVKLPERLRPCTDRVSFRQGDACNLKPVFDDYDLVTAFNLIDRLYDPAKFLRDITTRIRPGGLLILSSPHTWMEEHTPRDKWLGGLRKDGEPYTTFQALQEHLSPAFRLLHTEEVPFVLRETARKFQHTVAQLTIWERKEG